MKQRVNKFTDAELIEAYDAEPILGKLAAKFKVPHIQMWRRCYKLGLKFKNGGNKQKIPLDEILSGMHPQTTSTKLKKKLIDAGYMKYCCSLCGISSWNGEALVLQLDHINGDCSNHMLENLRLLCPNCHSQTHTWCGRNK